MTEALEEHELAALDDSTAMAQQPVCDIGTVQRAQSGDKEAFTQLFMQTYRAMYFTAKKTLTNDEDIYDALQIGYTKAYKYITRLSAPEKFYPWLHTIIQNAALDVLKDVLAYAADEFTETADAADAHADAERRADLRRILAKMDEARAQVLTLHYYDGLSLAEIARMLGEPASTVRSRLQAAKKELRALLEQSNIDENLYGGSLSAMIVTSLRSLIGTDILSAVVAQDMLDNILSGKSGRLEQAVYKMLARDRDHRVKHLAATLLAVCIGVAALTAAVVFTLIGEHSQHTLPVAPNSVVSSSHTSSTVTTSTLPSSTQTTLLSTTTSGRTTSKSSTTSTSTTTKANIFTTTKADTFVHDYRDGHANTVGNTANNLSLGLGTVAKQDEWLYFSSGFNHLHLFKMKTDGTGYQELLESSTGIQCINVIGDWIYYSSNGIYRARTDGSQRELISSYHSIRMFALEDAIYFVPYDNNVLYRIDLKTNAVSKQLVFPYNPHQVSVYNDMLISVERIGNTERLYVRPLSSLNTVLAEIVLQISFDPNTNAQCRFFTYDDTVFYITDCDLYCLDLTNYRYKQLLDNAFSIAINDCTMVSSYLQFFTPYNGGLIGIRTANSRLMKVYRKSGTLLSEKMLSHYVERCYCFDDNTIYFYDDNNLLYQANADLSNITLISR